MSRPPCFFIDQALAYPGDYALDAAESHHGINVLRCREGDTVRVFDGRGGRAGARVAKIAGKTLTLRLAEPPELEPPPAIRLSLAAAIPKGRRWQTLIEKCTELGADRVIPLHLERSVAKGEGDPSRWRRWAVEAAKQCLRSRLPEISPPQTLPAALEQAAPAGVCLLLAEPGGISPLEIADRLRKSREILFLIGPEGGFTPEELAACRRAGAEAIGLSRFVLRVETAAAAALAVAAAICR